MPSKRNSCAALIALSLLLPACGAQAAPLPTATPPAAATDVPTKTFTPGTPTRTAEPTKTPEPTAAPEPTEIPRVRLSADIENPTFVPWEKASKGLMEGPGEDRPFPEDAVFTFRWGLFFNKSYNAYEFTTLASYPDPELRPIRISGYGRTTTPDGRELIIVREDVHNADGTIGHWNLVVEREQWDSNNWYTKKQRLASGDKYLKPFVGEGGTPLGEKQSASKWLFDLVNSMSPRAMEFFQEFIDTNTVNPDGEGYLWVARGDTWVQ